MTSVTEIPDYRLSTDALRGYKDVVSSLWREWVKILDYSSATAKKELTAMKSENASLQWFRGIVDEKMKALEIDVVAALNAVAESA